MKKTFLYISGLTITAYLLYLAINLILGPSSLNQLAKKQLEYQFQASAKEKTASDYLLKIQDNDGDFNNIPYEKFALTKKSYLQNKDQIKKFLKEKKELINRVDQLLQFPGYAISEFPEKTFQMPGGFFLMNALRLKMLEIQDKIYERKKTQASRGLIQVDHFLKKSLDKPKSLLENLILVRLLNLNKKLMANSIENGLLSLKDFRSGDLKEINRPLDTSNILQNISTFEFIAFSKALKGNMLLDSEKKSFFNTIVNKLISFHGPVLKSYERSLNRHANIWASATTKPCYKERVCERDRQKLSLADYFINPLGNVSTYVFTEGIYDQLYKINEGLEEYNKTVF